MEDKFEEFLKSDKFEGFDYENYDYILWDGFDRKTGKPIGGMKKVKKKK